MTIDEAIQHCREQVQEQAKKGCYSCAEEHQQLAEWLKELKELRVRYSQLRRDCNETIDVIGKLRDELKAYKETWSKLGMWLADTRLAIAPDEFLNDVDEELVRVAQVDMIDTVSEWMDEHEVEAKQNCTDCIIDGTDACSRGAGRAVDDEICGDFIPRRSEIPNTCEDAISREAAVNAIYDLCGENVSLKENPLRDNPHMDAVVDALENLPSVTPQPKMGRWIADVDKWGEIVTTVNGFRCSECNTFNTDKDNYCPNCGAKMEVE